MEPIVTSLIGTGLGAGIGAGSLWWRVRHGGLSPIDVRVRYDRSGGIAGVHVDPIRALLDWAPPKERGFGRPFRAQWRLEGELQEGHRIRIEPKAVDEPNQDIFGKGVFELGNGRPRAVTPIPVREPTWTGFVHPFTNCLIFDELAESADDKRKELEDEMGGRVMRAARWIYDVVVLDRKGEVLYRLDPELVPIECR
ncbi:MAG: hypothetical protein AAGD38_02785 [Acidobacteriota bacterium]